jgi:hypothetical protein
MPSPTLIVYIPTVTTTKCFSMPQDRVSNQERLIYQLQREDRDTRQAKELLAELERAQSFYIAEARRAEKELANFRM